MALNAFLSKVRHCRDTITLDVCTVFKTDYFRTHLKVYFPTFNDASALNAPFCTSSKTQTKRTDFDRKPSKQFSVDPPTTKTDNDNRLLFALHNNTYHLSTSSSTIYMVYIYTMHTYKVTRQWRTNDIHIFYNTCIGGVQARTAIKRKINRSYIMHTSPIKNPLYAIRLL